MRKITIWLDSGKDATSKYEVTGTLKEILDFTEEEWDELSKEAQETLVRETLFDRIGWGYSIEYKNKPPSYNG